MNDKKAKLLRSRAKMLAKMSLLERVYLKSNRDGHIINHPDSARGLYQTLKHKGVQIGPDLPGTETKTS